MSNQAYVPPPPHRRIESRTVLVKSKPVFPSVNLVSVSRVTTNFTQVRVAILHKDITRVKRTVGKRLLKVFFVLLLSLMLYSNAFQTLFLIAVFPLHAFIMFLLFLYHHVKHLESPCYYRSGIQIIPSYYPAQKINFFYQEKILIMWHAVKTDGNTLKCFNSSNLRQILLWVEISSMLNSGR